MEDKIFNPAFFFGSERAKNEIPSPKKKKSRSAGYRTGDLVLNKQDILEHVEFLTLPGQSALLFLKASILSGCPHRLSHSVRSSIAVIRI